MNDKSILVIGNGESILKKRLQKKIDSFNTIVRINNYIIKDFEYFKLKDLTKNENEKVFIFNGWTFSEDPNLTPFDHAIYDIQLLNCYNT